MTGDASDPTAALIVHKQTEFTRQFSTTRSTAFASTVANRFYSDNSLERQRRIIECTKRRQARAKDKALEQELDLARLQAEYEDKQRMVVRQSQREISRMARKLEHVAAAYIQHIVRTFIARLRTRRRRARAARLIVRFCESYWTRRAHQRSRVAVRVQRQWRAWQLRQRMLRNARTIQRFLWSVTQNRRAKQQHAAIRIQRCARAWRRRRRRTAVATIERAWRLCCFWRGIRTSARRHRQELWRSVEDASARVLQRAIGRLTVRCRLVRTPRFAHFFERRDARRRALATVSADAWMRQRAALREAVAEAKWLQQQELNLRRDLDDLTARATESRTRLADERERLRRCCAWAETRRAKEDELLREELYAWENRKRFEIRMALERELEVERRARLMREDGRVEVS